MIKKIYHCHLKDQAINIFIKLDKNGGNVNMKSILIKRIKDEFGITSIAGRNLSEYSFYTLVGFVTRMRNGEEIK